MNDDEPGVPGHLDEHGRPYFFPKNQDRPADFYEQSDGFVPRWEYRGHTHKKKLASAGIVPPREQDAIRDVCVTREDSFGRMRFVTTNGRETHSWIEASDGDSMRLVGGEHTINALTFIPPLNVVAAASVRLCPTWSGCASPAHSACHLSRLYVTSIPNEA